MISQAKQLRSMIHLIRDLMGRKWFGELVVRMDGGNIVFVRKHEVVKIHELGIDAGVIPPPTPTTVSVELIE